MGYEKPVLCKVCKVKNSILRSSRYCYRCAEDKLLALDKQEAKKEKKK